MLDVRLMNINLAQLIEWAIWENLDKLSDLELILLKGHLYLEVVINDALSESKINNYKDWSFYKKTKELSLIESKCDSQGSSLSVSQKLFELNKIRNKLAHEFQFDINNGELEKWSQEILDNFEGQKFSKHTHRTKIIHSFSIIAKAITKIKNHEQKSTTHS